MDLSTLLSRVGLLSCTLLLHQLPAYAQADTEPDEWTPLQRAEIEANYKEFKADSIREEEERYIPSDTTVYTASAVDRRAQLPGGGGEQAVINAIQKAFRYPVRALKEGIGGKTIISFIVDENGTIIKSEIINSLGYGIDEELFKVLSRLPKFIPAECSGQAVRFGFTLPIVLRVQ